MNINDLLKNAKSIYLTGATKVTSYRVFSKRSITQITNAVFWKHHKNNSRNLYVKFKIKFPLNNEIMKITAIHLRKCWNLISKIQELSSPKEEYTYTLLNRYNGADLTFLFKEGLSLIIRRLSFNSNRNFLVH